MSGYFDTHRVVALASRQWGHVTRADLRALGADDATIDRRVAAGWLTRVHPSVYAVGHLPRSREARWMAATLMQDDAVLSHRAGAALHGFLDGTQPTEITVARMRGLPSRDGVLLHRQRLAGREVTHVRGIPVTTLVRTVLDLAAVFDVTRLARVFETAQVRRRLRPELVAAELVCRRGHRGTARMRIVLETAVTDPGAVETELELRFLGLCERFGLPRPETQVWFGPHRADFFFPDARLVVETDGAAWHRTPYARARDARKATAIEALGERVLRLSHQAVTYTPAGAAETVRSALIQR